MYHIELSKNAIDRDRLRELNQIRVTFFIQQSSNYNETSGIPVLTKKGSSSKYADLPLFV